MRVVIDEHLETRRSTHVTEPELDRRHRPEISDRPVGRAVVAGSAPVERGRRGAGAIDAAERRVAGPVEADTAANVVIACPSYLFHLSQKLWNFASPPDTLSGMHKIIEICADRAALHTEILALRQQVVVLKRKKAPAIASEGG